MNIWKLINWVRLSIVEGEDGGGESNDAGDGDSGADGRVDGGGDVGAGDGDAKPDQGKPDGDGDAKADTGGDVGGDGKAAAKGKDADPKTMLEAIDRGLSKESKDKPDGKKTADDPAAADQKGTKPKVEKKDELLKMPDGLSPSGQARFKNLVAENKAVSQQANEFKQQFEEVQGTLKAFQTEMQRTGATPETLEAFFTYTEAINGKRYEDAEKILVGQLKALQLASGRRVNLDHTDPLVDYPDLQKEVEDLKITPERAVEIAKARAETATRTQQQAQRDEQARKAGDSDKVREDAIKAVQAWATQQAASDIDYKGKEGKILAKLKAIAETYPPNLWLVRIKEAYADLGVVAPPTDTAGGKDNALRRGVGGGAGKPAPQNMHEALAQGLNW